MMTEEEVMKVLVGDFIRIKLSVREVAEMIRAGIKFTLLEKCRVAGWLSFPVGNFVNRKEAE